MSDAAPTTTQAAAPAAEANQGTADAKADQQRPAGQSENVPVYKGTKHKIKLDGKESEVDYDELIRGYQLASAANKRMEESNKIKTMALQLYNLAKSDPEQFLRETGQDPEEWAEKKIYKKLKREEDPTAAELEDLRQWKADWEKQQEEHKRQEQEKAHLSQVKQQKANYQKQIGDALTAAGISPTEDDVQFVARRMMSALQNEIEPNMAEIVDELKGHHTTNTAKYLKSLPPDKLIELIGQDKFGELRNWDLEKFKATGAAPSKVADTGGTKQSKPARVAQADFFAKIREKHL